MTETKAIIDNLRADTETFVERLNEQIKRQEAALQTRDWPAFTVADRSFHECFHDACGNGRLKHALATLRSHMEIALLEVAQSAELMEISIKEHRAILETLVQKTPAAAAEAMRKHVLSTRNRIQQRLQSESLATEARQ